MGLLALTALWICGSAALAQPRSLEYPVKAAYLPKFAPFVEWPSWAFGRPDSPFVICVVGSDPFGPLLDRSARGQKVGDRPFIVRRLASAGRDSGCHLLYVGHDDPRAAAAALQAVRGAPVLTVTDGARQGGARGVVHFTIQDARVRFLIDDQAAAEQGLTISSKLMSLALSVRRRA